MTEEEKEAVRELIRASLTPEHAAQLAERIGEFSKAYERSQRRRRAFWFVLVAYWLVLAVVCVLILAVGATLIAA